MTPTKKFASGLSLARSGVDVKVSPADGHRCAAKLSWDWRCSTTPREPKNGGGLPQSKIWRTIVPALCLLAALFAHVSTLHSQTATLNRVLELDGIGSYVELPPNIFNDLTEATVEGWMKWRKFGYYLRFFDSGITGRSLTLGQHGADGEPTLRFEIYTERDGGYDVGAANILRTNQWLHIAAVSGKGGMKLYLNGHLLGQDSYEGSFRAVNRGESVRLGRDAWSGGSYTDGQMAEVRVWNHTRTETQIRDNMFNRLTGQEPGLAGLWNFADGTANDASPGAHHGKLMGQAKVTEAALPAANALVPWSRLVGKVTDARGAALTNVTIRADLNGAEIARVMTGRQGEYALTLWTGAPAVDLAAAGLNDVAGLQFAVPISPYAERTNDWLLKPGIHFAGKVLALDGKTPHAALVLELVQPDGATADPRSSRREEAQTSQSAIRNPQPRIDQSLPTSAATTNQVLQLDGNGSYVELPPDLFTGLEEATVEGWARWEHLGDDLHLFEFGDDKHQLKFQNVGTTGDLNLYITRAGEGESFKMSGVKRNQWHHLAVVASASSLTLYLDGLTVGGGPYTGGFSAIAGGKLNFLGGCILRTGPDFHGQMDEVRVWRNARTAEQIRATMSQKLTGNEPGLFCLWNFDDPSQPGRDLTPGAHHGKLIGQAIVTNATLPALIFGKITDATGAVIAGASVEVRDANGAERRFAANTAGEYAFPLFPFQRYDLFVTTGKLSAYKLGFEPTPAARQQLDWTLAETQRGNVAAAVGRDVPIAPRRAEDSPPYQMPSGTVVARVLTDESGHFDFANVQPGRYQLRAQVLGGKAWFEAGKILYAQADLSDKERGDLRSIVWQLAPFKKGHWTTYTARDGLPSNHIRKFWVDPDGLLWIATGGGVSRFDGKDFSNLTTEDGLLSDRVFNLWREPSGLWWFCTARGVSRYDPALANEGRKAFHNFTEKDGLLAGAIEAVTQTPDGVMWFAGPGASMLSRIDGEKVFTYQPQGDFTNTYTMKITASSKGILWLGTGAGLIRFDGTNFVNVTKALGLVTGADSPFVAPGGSIWFGGGGDGLGLLHYYPDVEKTGGKKLESFTRNDGLDHVEVRATEQAQDGSLWLASQGGVSRFDGTNFVNFTSADGLVENDVITVAGTPDGALWFGTYNGGLSRYEPNSFTRFSQADGLPGARAGAAAQAPDGMIWVASGNWTDAKRGLARYDGSGFEAFLAGVAFPSNWVTGVALGHDGSVWAGLNAGGLARYLNGSFALLTAQDGLAGNDVHSVSIAANGDLWVGTESHGVSRYDGKTFQNFTKTNGLPGAWHRLNPPDASGNIWIGTGGGGVGAVRFDGRQFHRYTTTGGLADNSVGAIVPTPEGVVWFGTAGGLSRLDGTTYTSFTKARDRLADNNVIELVRDRDGVLWIGGGAGVTRYDGNVWSTLDERDGVGGNQAWLSLQDNKDGAFWIGTENGLTRYQPDRSPPKPPRVTVVADKEYTIKDGVAEITAGRRTQFKLSVVDLKTRGETRRYRWQFADGERTIDGARNASGWLPGTRETQFDWQTNRSGTYTFAVQYIDRDLNYSPVTTLLLKVTPLWYLNAWIVAPSGGAALGLIGWAFVARALVIRRKREAAQLREQLLEQEHAAHVTLAAKVTALAESNRQLDMAREAAEEARAAADDANKAKSLFLANMSHEIRTPMNAILGYSQILKRDKELPAKHRQSVETIEKSGDHLLGMINDILDLSKIEAGRMELQASDFDLNDLISGITAMFRMRCEEKELQLNVVAFADGPIPVHGDEGKLRQVLINLLGNAVKFTDQGEITLKIRPINPSPRSSRREEAHSEMQSAERGTRNEIQRLVTPAATIYRFDVIDTGPGISEADQKEIFQPFSQSEAGLKKGGTGLGLTISRRQVELMGGDVKLESTPGKGSRFYFEIELPPARGQVVANKAGENREVLRLLPGSQVNALVVDDNQNNRDVLSQLLLGIGCRVRLAESALEAFDRVQEALPDIIFMDIRMPGMNGADATKRIIAEHGPDKIKIVAITASVLEHEKAGHMAAGFHNFLAKPFRFPDVCASLKQLLNVDFEYADEATGKMADGEEMDASTCSIPQAVWETLLEAADRCSLTGLKKAIEPLEKNGDAGRKAAEHLKRLIHEGDFDRVSEFLNQVKQAGGVV